MDVFLVPLGPDRYELYCEEPDDPDTLEGAEPPRGFFRRIAHRVREGFAEHVHDTRIDAGRRHHRPAHGWPRKDHLQNLTIFGIFHEVGQIAATGHIRYWR